MNKRSSFLLIVSFALSVSLFSQTINTNFRSGDDGWVGAYIGYPSRAEQAYDLNVSWAKAPYLGNDSEYYGLIFSGKNYNGQVFLFAYKHLTGLRPNSTYNIIFNASFLTDYTSSNGRMIYAKAGAVNKPPATHELRTVEANFQKGEFGKASRQLSVLGPLEVNSGRGFQSILLHNYTEPFMANTNKDGELWVIIGVEIDKNLLVIPNIYLNTLRLILHNLGEYDSPSIQAENLSIYMDPDKQILYFESEFENDITALCIYSPEGHLIKVINYEKQFFDYHISMAGLPKGAYRLYFILEDGHGFNREIIID